ncbi:MAG TPA: DNA-formamidopyrimidine glycosylase family protein [Phycisphaerae bacterium]|jgi:formamidopyrimidine-DNA glycosylase
MPELPDIVTYIGALRQRIVGRPLERVRIISPFLLRSFDPPIEAAESKTVLDVRRLGKRIVLCLDDDLFMIFHLMIAGRLRWERRGTAPPAKIGLAAFDFPTGTLLMTEAAAKKRASLHLVRGESALAAHDAGGIEVLECDLPAFRAGLVRENHTLKRALTDPRLFSGIGNAYSDEILHAARLSPVKLTSKLSDEEVARLHGATRATLEHWIAALRAEFAERFPGAGDITAFRKSFAVHGRFGKPCPVCGCAVQRIRYADNETNYCPRCQTEGRILADRSLSRLLKDDWPRSIDDI